MLPMLHEIALLKQNKNIVLWDALISISNTLFLSQAQIENTRP
jgi:hypothetical protein